MSLSSGLTSSSRFVGQRQNYFSIDDILTTQQRIACKFEVPVLNMGYLDPCSESGNLVAGAQLELPMWLANSLGARRRRTVTVDLPKQYREVYREILSADATVVNLHGLGPHYYGFGSHLLEFEHAERRDIAESMRKAFQSRLRMIMDSSQNATDVDSVLLLDNLDDAERAIFQCGQTGLVEFLQWETRQSDRLTSSGMVSNLKKRKRAQIEIA